MLTCYWSIRRNVACTKFIQIGVGLANVLENSQNRENKMFLKFNKIIFAAFAALGVYLVYFYSDSAEPQRDPELVSDKSVIYDSASVPKTKTTLTKLIASAEVVDDNESDQKDSVVVRSGIFMSDLNDSIAKDIASLELPEKIEDLSERELHEIVDSVSLYFSENKVIDQLNNGEYSQSEQDSISLLLRYITDVRISVINQGKDELVKEIEAIKSDIASGVLAQPQTLTKAEKSAIEKEAYKQYQDQLALIREKRFAQIEADKKDNF